jgi:hypothetical protein
LQTQFSASPERLENKNLPAVYRLTTSAASAFVVERAPEAELVEVTQGIKFVVIRQG